MQAVAFILYFGLGLLQIAATIAGIQHWLGIRWFFAAIIAFFIASWPIVGTVVGMFGAHYAWGWSWLSAFFLFFGPLVVIGGIALSAGLFQKARGYSGPITFFPKHFNGDYSLGRSYWVNTFLISMFAPLLGVLMLPWLGENFPARYSSAVVILLTVLGIIAWFWAVIGTWASASKHVARGGKKGWATAAKVMIVLGMLRTVGEIAKMTGPLSDHWRVALGKQLGPAVSFQIRADGKSILLKGGINDDTAESLSKALDIAPSVTMVVLQSNGGWVRQGNMIAKVISDRGLNTYVEEECTSACTIAFLAGKDRAGEPNARIGFHSFSSVGADPAEAIDISLMEKTYRRAGLSPSFIAKIVATPSDKVWYPSHEELLAENVFTRLSLGGETALIATSFTTKENLSKEFAKVPAFAALAEKYPKEFNQVVEKAWVQVQARRPDVEVITAARRQVSQLAVKLLPIASDKILVEYTLLLAAEAEALGKMNAEACVELVFPTGKPINLAALLPREIRNQDTALMTEMIRSSDPHNANKLSKEESALVVQRLMRSLTPDQLQLFGDKQLRISSPQEACNAVVAYLRVLNSIPENDRAVSLRALYS